MESDRPEPAHSARDAEWLARHPALDRALSAAIRAPVVDARFDQQVWASIRAHEAERLASRSTLVTGFGMPWWLQALNVVACAVTVVVVASALQSAVAPQLAAAEVTPLVAYSTGPALMVLLASVAGLWFALRPTFGRDGTRL